ncbi:MAG: IPT/TIG domain-containing protein [Saprospiraceae bacterium]
MKIENINKGIRLTWLSIVTIMLAIFIACDKDPEISTKTELLSFGPSGVKHGDTLRLIGNNLQKVNSVEFTGGATVDKNNFVQQTEEQILLKIPNAAVRGKIKLKTSEGDIESLALIDFTVAPKIVSFNAQARPGENITINGSYLNWITKVAFTRDKSVTAFVSQAFDKLVVKVPDDAQTGKLVLTYSGTVSSIIESDSVLNVVLPVGVSFSPNPVKHQTDLVISGTNLDLVKQVLFTGVSGPVTSFTNQALTQLTVKVPASTTKGSLTFVSASGVSTVSNLALDVVLPSTTNLSPNPISPGENLTIDGANLDIVTGISFVGASGSVTSFISKTPTQIVVKVPSGAISGKLTFSVLNSTVTSQSAQELTSTVVTEGLNFPIYEDGMNSNWNGWVGGGWGGTKDLDNTSPVKRGTKSVRVDYVGNWGVPLQLGGANITLEGYSKLKVSIYGGTGSNGKKVNIGINENDGVTVTVIEGAWTDFTVKISDLGNPAKLTALYIKEYSNAPGDYTVYFDDIGLNY